MPNQSFRLLPQQQFLEQFAGRTTIVRRGFPEQFLRELLAQGRYAVSLSMAVADNDIGHALHQ